MTREVPMDWNELHSWSGPCQYCAVGGLTEGRDQSPALGRSPTHPCDDAGLSATQDFRAMLGMWDDYSVI